MKSTFLFNIFFFLLFISDKDKSIFCIENLSEEKVYVKNESLQINQESAQNSFRLDSLNNNINSIKLYVDLSFNINENKYDLINFELVGEEEEVNISFYRLENEFCSNKTKLELKLSDIVSSDNNYLIITRKKKRVKK